MLIPVSIVNQIDGFSFGVEELTTQLMADTPTALWQMSDSSGLPQDTSGNGNHMTAVSGTPLYGQSGPTGEATIQYASAEFHERATVSTAVTNFTVEMWLYRTGNASGDIFINGTTSGGFQIEYTSTAGAFRPNLPGVGTLGSIGTIQPDTWTHIALQRATTTWTAYINGVFAATPGTASPGAVVGNMRVIGAGATGHRFAHVVYYDSLLTPSRIAEHYFALVGLS